MKRIFTIAAAAAMVFGSASCQKELFSGKGGDSKVTFDVQIPQEVVTRADMSDGTTVNELVYEVYVGEEVMYEGTVEPTAPGSRQFSLELNLVSGMTYDLLFWAQNKEAGCYDTDNLKEVKVSYNGVANDERRDAFYGARIGFEATGLATSETIKLYRPFAQINFGSAPNDWAKAQPFITKGGLKSQVTMTNVPVKFNVYKGDVLAEKADVTFTYALSPASEDVYSNDVLTYKDANDPTKVYEYGWVAMNYVLAPKSESSMDNVTAYFVHDKNDVNSALVKEVLNVPFKQNYRTNILGEIFTGGNKFNVVIEPGFANDPIEEFPDYTIAEPVMFAFENGGSVTLNEDTVIPRNITTDKDVVINLNGHKLSYAAFDLSNKQTYIMVRVGNGGSLIINDNGKAGSEIVSNGYIASANAGSKIVVNGGSFTANTTTFQANGGEVYINGGEFSIGDEPDKRYVLNHIDAQNKKGLISVSGGKFHGFNPAAGKSENPDMSFVAVGYESVESPAGVWTVKAAAAAPVTLTRDVKTVATIQATDLAGADKTIEADFSATKSEYIVHGKQGGLIENVTIIGSNKRNIADKVQRGIFLSNITGDVTINKVNISDVAYTINTGGNIAADKKLTVTESELEGWTSPASFAEVHFSKCNFTIGTYYGTAAGADPSWNGCFRAATTTVLKDCTFEKGFYISLATMVAGRTLTLENCSVDGVVLTAENIAEYLNESEAGALKKVIVK